MATHSSILAWKIPWMEEPDRLQSVGSQRVRHNWATSPPSPPIFFIHSFIYRYLSCFHVLYSVNNATVKIGVQIFLQDTDFISSGCIPEVGLHDCI